jgi:hypothetical protein
MQKTRPKRTALLRASVCFMLYMLCFVAKLPDSLTRLPFVPRRLLLSVIKVLCPFNNDTNAGVVHVLCYSQDEGLILCNNYGVLMLCRKTAVR